MIGLNKLKTLTTSSYFLSIIKFSWIFLTPSLFQVVSAEILMASEPGCPIEMHKIRITAGDEMYDQDQQGDKFMPFHRAR